MRVRRPHRRRTRRLSLLVRFAIISFVLLLAVGLVLGRWLGSIQRERSLDDAVKRAQIVAEGAFQANLTPADLGQDFLPIAPETRQQLDDFIGAAIDADSLVRLKVWNAQHWIVYSDNPVLTGRWFPGDEGLSRALDGEVTSLVTDLSRPEEMEERDFGQLLAVYVPLRETTGQFSGDTGTVVGAFEIYVPYAPVATAIADDTRTLYLALAIGLAVLYLALFRLVAGASRRLRVQAQENAHQATHDALTDLPNRRQLILDLQAMLDRRYGSKYVALALVDIDHFKEINDALGHPSGDTVLQAIADRFREQMPDATVARIGGDEFAIAAENLPHAQAALAVATRIEDVLHAPFEVAGISVSVRPSIGIAMGPDDGRDADELLQHADVAMYVAKRTGTIRRLYSRNLDHYSPDRLSLAGELRDAIATASGEVHLAFQPKLDLRTDEVRGVECLVRWKHPQRGFVPPAEFLPIIENTELIAPLTWLVLDQALSTCASWRRHGLEIQMAVNISARTIGSPELYDRVVAALETHGLPPSALELELTESALLGDHSVAAENVTRFRDLGVSIAIDDFGTGYASIGYLTTMPISAVKIDRSFVDNMFSDPAASAVVNFSLGLGQQLGLEVVAEGIEDEPTLEELRRLGCNTAQGYFISRPLGATEFLHWLLAWSTRHLTPRDIAPDIDDPSSGGGSIGGSPYDLIGVGAPAGGQPAPAAGGSTSTGASYAMATTTTLAPLPAPTPFPDLQPPAPRAEHSPGFERSVASFGEVLERELDAVHQVGPGVTTAATPDDQVDLTTAAGLPALDVDAEDDGPVMPDLDGLGAAAPHGGGSLPSVLAASITTTSFDDLAPLYDRAPANGPATSSEVSNPDQVDTDDASASAGGTATIEMPATPHAGPTLPGLTLPTLSPLPGGTAPTAVPPLPPAGATAASGSSRITGGPMLPALPPLSLRLRGPGATEPSPVSPSSPSDAAPEVPS